jgi:hypothetical protein
MSNFDRRIARLEQALEATDIEDIARMTSEERGQLMIEILAPYVGEERARAHVHRVRTPHIFKNSSGLLMKSQSGLVLFWRDRLRGRSGGQAYKTQRRRAAIVRASNLSKSHWRA